MLREILSITGKPGLFKIIAHNGRVLIVEDVQSKKRMTVSPRDRIVSLADIAMYTDAEDKPLGEILDLVYAKNEGKPVDVKTLNKEGKLKDEFGEVLPDFDRDRVHDNDVKKLFNWYNILLSTGMTQFAEKEEEEEKVETAAAEAEAEEAEAAE